MDTAQFSDNSVIADGVKLKKKVIYSIWKTTAMTYIHKCIKILSITEPDPDSSVIWLRTLCNKLVINCCWKSIHWNNGLKVLLNGLSWRIYMSEDKML